MCERATLADPQRLWEQPYPGTIDQVRNVRAALRKHLGACPVADDAVHLLSELSANAIVHSDSGKRGGTFTVRAQHYLNNYVWGEVEDQGSTWDGNLSTSAMHPHGLFLLEQLASDCGVERISRVHVVWFRIDYPSRRSLAALPSLHRREAGDIPAGKRPDVTSNRVKPPPERNLPVPEMSDAQLSRYRRALVHYLKRCSLDDPRHGEMRTCLAEVLAEEQTRRQAEHASPITLTVPRVRL
jgi:serine/threonine-protein kinase RsbW